jgi:hypothetical protein
MKSSAVEQRARDAGVRLLEVHEGEVHGRGAVLISEVPNVAHVEEVVLGVHARRGAGLLQRVFVVLLGPDHQPRIERARVDLGNDGSHGDGSVSGKQGRVAAGLGYARDEGALPTGRCAPDLEAGGQRAASIKNMLL